MNARSPKARQRHRTLALEPLESRVVLDGNVRAFISGGNLRIIGDSAGNEIVIEQSRMRSFRISSRDGSTTINGRSGPLMLIGSRKSCTSSPGSFREIASPPSGPSRSAARFVSHLGQETRHCREG